MVHIEDEDSVLIGAIEMCGELQAELAKAIMYGRNEYEILRKYYNLSACLKNAGLNVDADVSILNNAKKSTETKVGKSEL